MDLRQMTPKDYAKAVGVGIATAVILSLVMVPAVKTGISPMPEPLALAFARVLFGEVPLPVGLLFHLVYVTFWSVVYIAMFKERDFLSALMLALILWVLVLILFFPIVGWGFFGLDVSPTLMVVSLVPHLLFAIILWGMCHWVFPVDREKFQARA